MPSFDVYLLSSTKSFLKNVILAIITEQSSQCRILPRVQFPSDVCEFYFSDFNVFNIFRVVFTKSVYSNRNSIDDPIFPSVNKWSIHSTIIFLWRSSDLYQLKNNLKKVMKTSLVSICWYEKYLLTLVNCDSASF